MLNARVSRAESETGCVCQAPDLSWAKLIRYTQGHGRRQGGKMGHLPLWKMNFEIFKKEKKQGRRNEKKARGQKISKKHIVIILN